jgi:hypothetical protein
MTQVGEGNAENGLRLMKPYLAVPPAEFEALLAQFKVHQPETLQRYGKTIGHEFIRDDKIGANLLRIVQMQRFEKHAMRWSFYFYRGNNGWVLNAIKTDEDIQQLFP